MALDRTWFNALVDDDGTNTVGTVWGKDDITNLLNSVDAEIARLDNSPRCSMYLLNGNGQTIPSGTLTVILFDAVDYLVGGAWWSASDAGTIICPVTGIYLVTAHLMWDVNPTGARMVKLMNTHVGYVTPELLTDGMAATYTTQLLTWVVPLQAGQGIQVHALHTTGAALRVGGYGYPNTNFIRAHRIG